MKDFYYSIKEKSTGSFKDKGSKFLSFAFPVENPEEIKSIVKELRSEFHDARHHCYAYVLGEEGREIRVNDDGEPNHSAGDSILAAIRSRNLTYLLVVVVRYFGGTKLGISGLINAYRSATENALQSAEVVKIYLTQKFEIVFPYKSTQEVMQVIGKFEGKIAESDYKEICRILVNIKIRQKKEFEEKLKVLMAREIIQSFELKD